VINILDNQKGIQIFYFKNDFLFRFAYIEFSSIEGKEKSKQLNDSLFKGRQIKIDDKRKNVPNYFGKCKLNEYL
jgi:hypothetical protein